MSPWCHDGPVAFNGDPTELLIDKSKYEEEQVKQTLLFGPIPSSQVSDDTTSLSQFEHHSTDHFTWNMFPEFDGIDTPSQVYNATQSSDYASTSDNDRADEMDELDESDNDVQEDSDSDVSPSSEDEDVRPPKRTSKRRKGNKVQKHRRVAKVSDEKKFPCDLCNRRFGRRYNLKTHIRTH